MSYQNLAEIIIVYTFIIFIAICAICGVSIVVLNTIIYIKNKIEEAKRQWRWR